MIKRMNKVTSLLLAAAAVLSIVPSTGASASVRLGNKEGTIKEGIAFDGGKYSYYGFKSDSADTGVYFNNGTDATDALDSNLEDYRLGTLSKYNTKYAYAYEQSNNDEYLVDLSTGKIVDDTTKEEKKDQAENILTAKVKKADRYNAGTISSFDQILQGQFGEVWYKYAVDGDKATTVSDVAAAPAKIEISILSKNAFDTNMNNSVVSAGFAGNVAGEKFAFIADGSSSAKVAAKQVEISNDGAATPAAVAPTAVFTVANTGITNAGIAPTAGTLKTTLDTIKASYDSYIATQVRNGYLVRNDLSVAPGATASNGTTKYDFTAKAPVGGSVQASIAAELLKTQETLNAAVTKAAADYAATNTDVSGATLITSYADYIAFVNTVIGNKITAAGTAYTNNFAAFTPLVATLAADQAKDKVELTAVVDGAIDSAADKAALTAEFGSVFTDGNAAGQASKEVVNTKYYGFTNDSGSYIDASYTANMKVYSKTKGRAVLVEKFGEEVKDAGLKVDLVSVNAIAQDKDYIYAVTKVKVTGTGAVAEDQMFIQKISKAQGSKEDGAYTPKEVKSYQLNNGIYDNDDATYALGLFDGSNKDYKYLLGMSVKDGNIYVTRANEDQVKVYKVTLDDSVKADVLANGATLKTDVDSALVLSNEDDDNAKEDITSFGISTAADDAGLQGITAVKNANDSEDVQLNGETLYRHPSVSIDVNGNTWALKKGKVTKFDGITKKSDIYTVDGAMSAIDVYDENNLIAWDVDGDIYTNVAEGKVVTGKEAEAVKPATETPAEQVKTGWDKQADGSWKYFGQDGKELTGWQKVNGVWYYMDSASKLMKTGWVNDNGTWYYMQSSGAMKTGWVNDNGTWYFLNSSGAMQTGWLNDNGTWYFLNSSGAMLSNTVVGGYKLGASGAWVK